MHETEAPIVKALVIHPSQNSDSTYHKPLLRLEEAVGLTIALGLEVALSKIETMREIRASTYFGKGKLEAIDELAQELDVNILIIDDVLSPIQQRNLEKRLGLKVIDRTGLILEIFSLRARTKEGKLQVELARLSYEKSRLVKTWTHLERQRGGTGKTGGPGERQIELDRRIINDKILKLKKELEQVRRTRSLQRAGRDRVPYPIVALVGYTNAGKSTLFNTATDAKVLAKDMLFATLDTTSRALKTPRGRQIILTDTVGFITDLPHELVAAFRATLEEVALADILIHVRDISIEESEAQKRDVDLILEKIIGDSEEAPIILEAWNKADLLAKDEYDYFENQAQNLIKKTGETAILLSAQRGTNFDKLFSAIDKELSFSSLEKCVFIAPEHGKLRAWLYEKGVVIGEINGDAGKSYGSGTILKIRIDENLWQKFSATFNDFVELPPRFLKNFDL